MVDPEQVDGILTAISSATCVLVSCFFWLIKASWEFHVVGAK